MSKTSRRIEITAFRRKRLAGVTAERPAQQSTTDVDESLVAELLALVQGLTGERLNSATAEVRTGRGNNLEDETD